MHRYIAYAKRDGSTQLIQMYNDVDKSSPMGSFASLGHCNGMTYKDGYLYICSYYGSKNTKRVTSVNATSMKLKTTYSMPVAVSGIAYDESLDKWVLTKGNNVYIFGKLTNKKYKNFKTTFTDGTYQDVCARNGMIYICRSYVSGSTSAIDAYDHSGEYLGSYIINANELESCDIDTNGYIHYLTWNKAELVKTNTKV